MIHIDPKPLEFAAQVVSFPPFLLNLLVGKQLVEEQVRDTYSKIGFCLSELKTYAQSTWL